MTEPKPSEQYEWQDWTNWHEGNVVPVGKVWTRMAYSDNVSLETSLEQRVWQLERLFCELHKVLSSYVNEIEG